MKLETFFEKFDQFADAPDAVAKMRELVLELSATGRLIPEALERPVEDDTRLMGTIVELVMGQAPAGDEYNTEGRGTVFVKVGEFGPLYPREEVWTTNPLKFAKKGDVLVCVVGATVGKLNLAIDCAIGRSAAAIRPSAALDTKFLYYSLIPYTLRLRRNSRGSAQGVIGKAELNAVSLWVPSREVQKRIVAKVDELMALCDRLEAQQQERETRHAALARASLSRFADAPTPANLEYLFHSSFHIPPSSLRQSILTLAVQGKLVPQDPNDEPAKEILAGIADDIAKAVRAKRMRNSRPIPAYEDEFPFALPAGWAWAPLGTLTAAEDGAMCDGPFGSKLKTEHYIPTTGYAVLRLGNIGVGYFIHGKEGHISREHFESLPSNHTAPGDLLVAGLADPLVRCCEIPPDLGPAVNKSDCFRVRLSKRMERSYVRHYLNSPIAKAFAAEENHGMTRERINLANAKALPVSVPPLAEQRRIVAKVEHLMALVDALETQLAASRATAANLLSALVAELTS